MEKTINLEKNAYEPFIDVLKGFAIISVVINHILPYYIERPLLFCLWGEMAVPLFLIIQSFHYYKCGLDSRKKFSFSKFGRKILLPYVFAQLMIILILILKSVDYNACILQPLSRLGGIGPGEYYFWIYIEFIILLPICSLIFKRLNGIWLPIVMAIVAESLDLVCSYINLPLDIYKVSFIRYFFLIYIGYLWATEGIKINSKRTVLSLVSVICMLVLYYTEIDFSPFVYGTKWQRIFHWFCYFYVAFFLPYPIKYFYERISPFFQNLIRYCGSKSWAIFCSQIFVFSVFTPYDFDWIDNFILRCICYASITAVLSFIIPFMLDFLISKYKLKMRRF